MSDPLALTLAALAAFRVTRLIGWDDLTISARRRVTGLSDRDHHDWASYIDQMRQAGRDAWNVPASEPPPISERRFYLSKMLRCPWCVGFWVSAPAAVAALGWEWWTLAAWFAISAIVGLIAKNLDR